MNAEYQDSMDWTPEAALDDAKKSFADGNAPDCLMIIALWNKDGYDTRFWNCGMKCSEMVALLEIEKAKILNIIKPTPRDK